MRTLRELPVFHCSELPLEAIEQAVNRQDTARDFGERGSDSSSLIHLNSRVFSLRMGPRIPCGSDAIDLNSWMRSARNASVWAAMEKLVKLFKKQKSRFYCYDFTVRGHRYRGSTDETKAVRPSKVASLKLAEAIENSDPLPRRSLCCWSFPDGSYNGSTMPDGRTRQKSTTAMDGDCCE